MKDCEIEMGVEYVIYVWESLRFALGVIFETKSISLFALNI
jgi:hypothetical protein